MLEGNSASDVNLSPHDPQPGRPQPALPPQPRPHAEPSPSGTRIRNERHNNGRNNEHHRNDLYSAMTETERPISQELTRFPLFSGLSIEDADRLGGAVHTRRFRSGQEIFHEGDDVQGFYLVREGTVKVFKVSSAGNEQVLAVVTSGNSFAEAAVFQMARYPASAQAIEESSLLFVERNGLLQQLRRDPDLALRMLAGMAIKLHSLVRLVEDLTLRDARGRLCRYLLNLGTEDEGQPQWRVQLPVRQALLARMLGLTGETLSRTMKTLRDEGFIETEGRGHLVILDPNGLKRVTGELETPCAS